MQVKWTTAGTHEGVAMIQREAFRSQWGWVSSRSHRGCFASVWFEWLEKRLTQPGVMIQIQWDRQTDVERGSDALTWTPPPLLRTLWGAVLYNILALLPNTSQKYTGADAALLKVLSIYSLWTDLHAITLWMYALAHIRVQVWCVPLNVSHREHPAHHMKY